MEIPKSQYTKLQDILNTYLKEDLDPCDFDVGNPTHVATMFFAIFASCYTPEKSYILKNCFLTPENNFKTLSYNLDFGALILYNHGPNVLFFPQTFWQNIREAKWI